MQLTQISPSKQQLEALMKYPKDTPVVMTNILKFKTTTDAGNESGEDAYNRYLNNVMPLVIKAKAKLVYKGIVATTVIGDSEDQPDMILLIEYPSVANFLNMISNPAYQKASTDRTIALKYGGLIACKTID